MINGTSKPLSAMVFIFSILIISCKFAISLNCLISPESVSDILLRLSPRLSAKNQRFNLTDV